MGAGTAGSFLATNEMITEQCQGWAQRCGGGVDPAASAAGSEPGGLVEPERELPLDEEVFEGAGQRPGGATGPTCPFQQCLGVGLAVAEQPTEFGDHHARSSHAMRLGGVLGELAQPPRWISETHCEVIGLVDGPVGVTLPTATA